MRMYFVGHFMLSSIQQGIQGAHALVELCMKERIESDQEKFEEWANFHKTIICVSGGNTADLEVLDFDLTKTSLIWAVFREDLKSLNGSITSIALLDTGEDGWAEATGDRAIMNYIRGLPLAR